MSHSIRTGDIWHDLHPMGGEGTVEAVRLEWGCGTDVGRTRAVNEDALLAELPVFVVADGMGGHDAGDVASAVAIDRFRSLVGAPVTSIDDVTRAIDGANHEIVERGATAEMSRSMGTTVTGLVLVRHGDLAGWLVFNVGDSRVYRYSDRRLEQISVDHSYVQELVDSGHLSAESARSHPQRNVVTRALGVVDGADADLWLREPIAGERYLVCSDGLCSEIDDEAIAGCLEESSPELAASLLIDAALVAGGRDNISVIVVDVLSAEPWDADVTAPRPPAPSEGEQDGTGSGDDVVVDGAPLISVPHGLAASDDLLADVGQGAAPEADMITSVPTSSEPKDTEDT